VIEGLYKIPRACVHTHAATNNANNNAWPEDFFEHNLIYVELYSF
jgi:hypothetical protein